MLAPDNNNKETMAKGDLTAQVLQEKPATNYKNCKGSFQRERGEGKSRTQSFFRCV